MCASPPLNTMSIGGLKSPATWCWVMRELLVDLARYQVWANDAYRKIILTVSPENYDRPTGLSCGTLRDVCIHINAAMTRCLTIITKNRDTVESDIEPLYEATKEELMAIWKKNDEAYLALCLDSRIKRIGVEEFSAIPVENFLTQYVNHSTHHRGTLPIILRKLGYQPTDTDYLDYLFVKYRK